MSAKWRALQHRHRYTYTSTTFPDSYLSSLGLLLSSSPNPHHPFLSSLSSLPSLPTTFLQVPAANHLASSLPSFLSSSPSLSPSPSTALRLYLELLFLDNSLPLHRSIISGLLKCHRYTTPLVAPSLLSLFRDYSSRPSPGFTASRAALSLLSHPKLGFLDDTLANCAPFAAADAVSGLRGVIRSIENGSTPSPSTMEQCQEAFSCCYYLLQRFPDRFPPTEGVFASLVAATVDVLRSSSFSRDCLVAAGLCFWASLSLRRTREELERFVSRVFFAFRHPAASETCGGDLYADVASVPALSRLCLIRGMLTTVPRELLNAQFRDQDAAWTTLYDGILRELCGYCENPMDSHFNFHALTVMQICFQQIKTSMLAGIVDFSGGYDPIPEDVRSRVLRIVWNNLEDPLSQTVKQVHLVFDLFLDVLVGFLSGEEDREGVKAFMHGIASTLLCLGPRCKGRYVPLVFLTRRLGAKGLLEMHPKLLFETVRAYVDNDVCCAATSFLKCFLECLRDECWSSDGVESGYEIFRGFCLPPFLQGIVSGQSKLRTNLNTYALPAILEVDVDSIFPMLAFISIGPSGEETGMSNVDMAVDQCVAALVSLLKVSRLLALIEGDIDRDDGAPCLGSDCDNGFALVTIKSVRLKVPVKWLVLALTHADEHIRIDAAESLFLNPKTSSLPSPLELQLMRKAVPLNMRCCSTAFQMKWTSLFRKFFSRVKTALERQVKQGSWQLKEWCGQNHVGQLGNKDVVNRSAVELFSFVKWLSSHLFFSCYPSAPYERKMVAMALILLLVDVWPAEPPSRERKGIYPYNEAFVSADSTLLLVGSIIDSWDRLRESSYNILMLFPTPLPGLAGYDSVKEVITWAKKLVSSPRVRESDAGALTLRLIFKKYVVELGWVVRASADVICWNPRDKLLNGDLPFEPNMQVVEYLSSLVEWLEVAVEEGEKDLSSACKSSFVHGILLALRYTFEELDWNSEKVLLSISEMKSVLEKLLDLIMRITSLALWVVSADAWYLPMDDNDAIDDIDILDDPNGELDASDSLGVSDGSTKPADKVGPASQIVMVGCWLAMKEVSLLLGTIVRKIPLPGSTYSRIIDESNDSGYETGNIPGMPTSDAILNEMQLENIGNHFLQILLKMKHNGAIDKTRAGFTALCNRLLNSNDPRLCKMVESWLQQLMGRTIAKGQTVNDLLRRSAGIPAAFIAFFLSEPEGTPKKLLPQALQWLIDVVNTSLPGSDASNLQNGMMLHQNSLESLNQDARKFSIASGEHEGISKTRDEGVVPTVHSFNVLRAAFNDTNLAADTSGFAAEALIISIRSFSSPYWEVRNGACLAYTALVRRMIGFLNVHKRESARRALTGVEFFHRYPPLFPFLYNELKIATKSLPDETCEQRGSSDIAKAIHPSLCPILILLSRLKPSFASSDPNDAFDPFLLMPFISRCATQSNLRVRILASRALTGLVSNERLPSVVVTMAKDLPCQGRQMKVPRDFQPSPSSVTDEICGNAFALSSFSSYNAIHGILLQLGALVTSNFKNLTLDSRKDEIFRGLIPMLVKCSWLGSFQLCPCPTINALFLYILDHMLNISRTCIMEKHTVHIQSLLEELSLQYLDKKFSNTMFDPTKVELHKQAASSYFSCLFGGDSALSLFKLPEAKIATVQLQQRIMFCLHDSTYEVRLATLKQIMKLLKTMESADAVSNNIHFWVKSNLQHTLMQMLDVEDHFKCIYHVLRIISVWNLLQFEKYDGQHRKEVVYLGSMDCDSVFGFWNKLISLNSTATHSKTREALLSCMGICVRQLILFLRKSRFIDQSEVEESTPDISVDESQCEVVAKIYGYVDVFVSLVKQHSAPSEPVNMRRAAAESIVSSSLLMEVGCLSLHVSNCKILCDTEETELNDFHLLHPSRKLNMYAKKILEAWSTCIHMLEDEDVGLREKLAKDVQSSITLSRQTDLHDIVPAQVERVIESCFEFLSSAFGHWIEYFHYLSQWSLEMTQHTISQRDLVRQVFDKEVDNHHEEKLLICQLCCMHLEKLLRSPSLMCKVISSGTSKNDVALFIQRWRLKFLQQLIHIGNKHLEAGGKVDWVGGMGNHKDVFVAVYGSLLGLYAFLQCHGDLISSSGTCDVGEHFSSLFDNIKVSIQPFLQNPLICNLYSLLQSHVRISIHSMDNLLLSRACPDWEDFDPYFLLR